jgi:purine-binding chemotaxis protein CheW
MTSRNQRSLRTTTQQQSVDTARQYLLFLVAGLELAVPLESVSEIVPYEGVSTVPGTPAHVRGVVPVRGRVVPVIDLAVKLGRTPEPVGKRTCILIVDVKANGAALAMGVVMDGVATLLDADAGQIAPKPSFGGGVQVRHLEGLLPTERGMIPLIDIARVFEVDELDGLAEVATSAPPPGHS